MTEQLASTVSTDTRLGKWVWEGGLTGPSNAPPMMSQIRTSSADWRAAGFLYIHMLDVQRTDFDTHLGAIQPGDQVQLDHRAAEHESPDWSTRYEVLDVPLRYPQNRYAYYALKVGYLSSSARNDPPSGALVQLSIPSKRAAMLAPEPLADQTILSDTWSWSAQTTLPPNSGQVRSNNGAWIGATLLNIDSRNVGGASVGTLLAQVKAGDTFHLQHKTDPLRWATFSSNSAGAVIGTYYQFGVTFADSFGTLPNSGTQIALSVTRPAPTPPPGGEYLLRIDSLLGRAPFRTMWDGQYVRGYSPGLGLGQPDSDTWLVTTPDPKLAKRYPDLPSALAERTRIDTRAPWRSDVRPNMPLSNFATTPIALSQVLPLPAP